jgi:hypothetical protein
MLLRDPTILFHVGELSLCNALVSAVEFVSQTLLCPHFVSVYALVLTMNFHNVLLLRIVVLGVSSSK